MMQRTIPLAALALAAPLCAAAADGKPDVGSDTRAWVEFQESGKAAQGEVRPMPGEVADKVYQRYLDSFENQIPEQYERERFVSGGSGGS